MPFKALCKQNTEFQNLKVYKATQPKFPKQIGCSLVLKKFFVTKKLKKLLRLSANPDSETLLLSFLANL